MSTVRVKCHMVYTSDVCGLVFLASLILFRSSLFTLLMSNDLVNYLMWSQLFGCVIFTERFKVVP